VQEPGGHGPTLPGPRGVASETYPQAGYLCLYCSLTRACLTPGGLG
jgi:hypothetical protein